MLWARPSVPGMESSRMSQMTERVSAGDVGDIGESGTSKGPGYKSKSRSCWVHKSRNQRWLVVLKQVPKVQMEPGPQI